MNRLSQPDEFNSPDHMGFDEAVTMVGNTRIWMKSTEGQAIGWAHAHKRTAEEWRNARVAQLLVMNNGLLGRFYWCDGDMSSLIIHAAKTLPDEPLDESEVPAPHGCCILATPLKLTNHPYIDTFMRGWCWSLDNRSRFIFSGPIVHIVNRHLCSVVAVDQLEFGHRPLSMLESRLRGSDDIARRAALRTFWTISQQTIARCLVTQPHRTTRRRLSRDRVIIKDATVVVLRRIKQVPSGSEDTSIEWSHRWMVSGHWRQQWVPSLNAHRARWIAPYIKGPDDKPLVLKERRYTLVR